MCGCRGDGLLLFFKFKPPELYSLLLPREQAIKLAEQSILKLVGIDVSDWQRYAMYWLDRDTVNKLHHLGMLAARASYAVQLGTRGIMAHPFYPPESVHLDWDQRFRRGHLADG